MSRLSRVCRDRLDSAARPHGPCTGCDCACHHVRAPRAFRALVEALAAPGADPEPESRPSTPEGQR